MNDNARNVLRGMAQTFMKLKADSVVNWLDCHIHKNPLDLWIMQELIYRIKPDIIIECGTGRAGSSFYFATILELIGKGKVLTVDARKHQIIDSGGKARTLDCYNRVEYFYGNSVSGNIFESMKSKIAPTDIVLVDLDSDHSFSHVLNEIRLYSNLVTKNSYLIVEDSIVQGPAQAIEAFLKEDDRFEPDLYWEKFLFTFNPNGYLKRIK